MKKIYFERIEGYDVKMPVYGTKFSAGIDCYLPNYTEEQEKEIEVRTSIDCSGECKKKASICPSKKRIYINPHEIVKFPLGIRCAFDDKYVLMAKNRSGLSLRGLTKLAQVVDSDYRGQLFVSFVNCLNEAVYVHPGDRIIQFVLLPYIHAEICEGIPKRYENTDRGTGGFGSTGR